MAAPGIRFTLSLSTGSVHGRSGARRVRVRQEFPLPAARAWRLQDRSGSKSSLRSSSNSSQTARTCFMTRRRSRKRRSARFPARRQFPRPAGRGATAARNRPRPWARPAPGQPGRMRENLLAVKSHEKLLHHGTLRMRFAENLGGPALQGLLVSRLAADMVDERIPRDPKEPGAKPAPGPVIGLDLVEQFHQDVLDKLIGLEFSHTLLAEEREEKGPVNRVEFPPPQPGRAGRPRESPNRECPCLTSVCVRP